MTELERNEQKKSFYLIINCNSVFKIKTEYFYVHFLKKFKSPIPISVKVRSYFALTHTCKQFVLNLHDRKNLQEK